MYALMTLLRELLFMHGIPTDQIRHISRVPALDQGSYRKAPDLLSDLF